MRNDQPSIDLFSDGDEAVFSRFVAGELTDEERDAVDLRLRSDREFRETYLRWSILETDLERVMIEDLPASLPAAGRRNSPWRKASAPWALILAAVLIGLTLRTWHSKQAEPISPKVNALAQSEREQPPTIAVVVDVTGRGSSLHKGQRLTSGRISLDSGTLLVSFLSGARLFAEGPAELELREASQAELIHGDVALQNDISPQSFRLDLPNASVVDLGSEFAVHTGPDGQSVVRIGEGEVSVSVLGEDGTSWVSEVVGGPQNVTLMPRDANPLRNRNEPPSGPEPFGHVPPVPLQPLTISDGYVRAVRELKPAIYWRFETLDDDGMVPDEGSLGCRGRLVNPGASDAITVSAGQLQLKRTPQVRRLESERELPPVGGEALTIELWAQTAEVGWQTVFGLLVPGFPGEQRSSAVLEFAANTGLVHGPMAIRAVCRTPSGRTGGTNLFGEDLWSPGKWHHLVLTRGAGQAKLYVNGVLVAEARVPPAPDHERYFAVLGQLHAVNWPEHPGLIRQFVGAIDECAIYEQVLSAEQILRHYQLGQQAD